jgi:hypothetical protein
MGPYYRNTSQGMGNFFDLFYEHPTLMVIFVAGVFFGAKTKRSNKRVYDLDLIFANSRHLVVWRGEIFSFRLSGFIKAGGCDCKRLWEAAC